MEFPLKFERGFMAVWVTANTKADFDFIPNSAS
jgi:hypothetical protein